MGNIPKEPPKRCYTYGYEDRTVMVAEDASVYGKE